MYLQSVAVSHGGPLGQQILRYHHREVALDNSRLFKLAMVIGCTRGAYQSVTAATNKGWQCHAGLARHLLQLAHRFDIKSVRKEKHWVAFKYFQDDSHSSVLLYRTSLNSSLCSIFLKSSAT